MMFVETLWLFFVSEALRRRIDRNLVLQSLISDLASHRLL